MKLQGLSDLGGLGDGLASGIVEIVSVSYVIDL